MLKLFLKKIPNLPKKIEKELWENIDKLGPKKKTPAKAKPVAAKVESKPAAKSKKANIDVLVED